MAGRKRKSLIGEQADDLVQGLVDILPYPACIISQSGGLVAINSKARELIHQGMDASRVVSDEETIELGDTSYCVVKKLLNHSTDFVLCELHSGNNPIDRIRASTRRLERALGEVF